MREAEEESHSSTHKDDPMAHDESTEQFDSDALLHIGRPYWFDRHPSQAEGEDY